MAKQPDINCRYCQGTGTISVTHTPEIRLPCRCTNEKPKDELPDGLKSIV